MTYINKFLPFGLRSAPKIFSAVADAAQWVLVRNGVKQVLHYLDDFALVESNLAAAEKCPYSTFERLGLPLEPNKLEGPTTYLIFLRIEVDTLNLQLRLPAVKLDHLQEILKEEGGHKTGASEPHKPVTAQHASKVVRLGRAFLERLYALQNVQSAPDHHVQLNVSARADVMWWQLFIS